MMAKDRDQRYPTPAEVAVALQPLTTARRRRPRRMWYIAAVAALLLTGVLTAAATMIIRTDSGEFVLETHDPNIAVQLDKAGVKIHDRSSNREYLLKAGKQSLPSGDYEIDVKELPTGIEMSGKTFRLKRGETVRLTAYIRPAEQKGEDKPVRRADFQITRVGSAVLKTFGKKDKPLSQDDVTADQGGWRIESEKDRTVRLYEIANPGVDECMVVYEAQLKTQKVRGKAYLEMWCRFPDKGEFFSKDIVNPTGGTTDWVSCQTVFWLKKGERPDLIKLNVVIEGSGTLWIKDIKLRKEQLPLGLPLDR
jgi:hypothetical protein